MTQPKPEGTRGPPVTVDCTERLPKHRIYKSQAARSRHAEVDAAAWNSTHAIGAPVCVHRDNGERLATWTRSEARRLGDSAVVWVEGIAGCYGIFRIHDRNPEEP